MSRIRTTKRELYYLLEGVRHELGLSGAKSSAPHVRKRRHLRSVQLEYGLQTFVETGTYYGDMLAAMAPHFVTCHSIELSPELHAAALRRFSARSNVFLHQGDSGEVLEQVLALCTGPALFWLDAHYSAGVTARGEIDSPIEREIGLIFEQSQGAHAVLIDDARLFVGADGYPPLEVLRTMVANLRSHYDFQVRDDIIWLLPRP